jgi:hypothetical protein
VLIVPQDTTRPRQRRGARLGAPSADAPAI